MKPFSRTPGIGPESGLLLACCRQRFEHVHRATVLELCARDAIDWESVFRASVSHAVAPLVGENLERARSSGAQVPEPVLGRFRLAAAANRHRKEQAGHAVAELLAYCNERNIDVMLVKGFALDQAVYESPFLTSAVDVDVVFKPKREQLGREQVAAISRLLGTLANRFGCTWECDWFEHHDITMNGIIQFCFQQVWDDSVRIRYRDRDARLMCPLDLFIASCVNCHRRRYVKLKTLCDVAEVLNRFRDLDWDAAADKVGRIGCAPVVYAALVAVKATLGVGVPDEVLALLGVGAARGRLIRRLLDQPDRRLLSWGIDYGAGRLDKSLLRAYAVLPFGQSFRSLKEAVRRVGRRG